MGIMDGLLAPIGDAHAKLAESLGKALIANGFSSAQYAATGAEAARMATEMIDASASVAIPSSVTLRQIGLLDALAAKGCRVSQFWGASLTPEQRREAMLDGMRADWFVTGANAVTVDGKIINIDATGNRVAAMAWGMGKLLFIFSLNKVMPDVETAIARVRMQATPPNSQRLSCDIPCAHTGRCMSCRAQAKLCRVVEVMEAAPLGRDCRAIMVGETLGY